MALNLQSDRPNPHPDHKVILVLLAAVTLALGWILLPFSGTLLWSAIIALLFTPVNRWLLGRWPTRRNVSALLTLCLVLIIVFLPFLAVTASLAQELATLYAKLQSGEVNPERFLQQVFDALPEEVRSLLDRLGLANFAAVQSSLATLVGKAGQFMAGRAFSLGQNTVEFVASLFITTYLSFFLIRDGRSLARSLHQAIPLTLAHRQELQVKFTTVIRATVKGTLLVAVIQGALGGLAFWYLDLSGALLWAVLMAFLSLVPAVGAALVWLPVAVYFFLTGLVGQGLALLAWGVLVIGLVDNLLRPLLVGRDTRMPDYVVLISTLGGMSVFGINGFVLGPLVAAMFMAVWHIRLSELSATTQAPTVPDFLPQPGSGSGSVDRPSVPMDEPASKV